MDNTNNQEDEVIYESIAQSIRHAFVIEDSSGSETDIEVLEPENTPNSDSEADLFVSSSDETDIEDEVEERNRESPTRMPMHNHSMYPTGSQSTMVPLQNPSLHPAGTQFTRIPIQTSSLHPAGTQFTRIPIQNDSMYPAGSQTARMPGQNPSMPPNASQTTRMPVQNSSIHPSMSQSTGLPLQNTSVHPTGSQTPRIPLQNSSMHPTGSQIARVPLQNPSMYPSLSQSSTSIPLQISAMHTTESQSTRIPVQNPSRQLMIPAHSVPSSSGISSTHSGDHVRLRLQDQSRIQDLSDSSQESLNIFGNIPSTMYNVNNTFTNNVSSQNVSDQPVDQMSSQLIVTEVPMEVPMDVENVTAHGSQPANESMLDFTVKKDKKKEEEDSSDDEGQCCIICYEPWTNSGAHRVASLKCGHVFGQSCIEKWLKGNCGKCPQCNAKAKKRDIRVLYVKALKVTDTAERDRALKDLESEKSMRRSAEIKAEQFRLKYQLAIDESKKMQIRLKAMENSSQQTNVAHCSSSKSNSAPVETAGKYILQKTIQVSPNGKCRVMTFDNDALLVSLPSPRQLFPGFGVKKISAIDGSSAYISIHKNLIRDVCCNSRHDGLLLTASADKTMKITSLRSYNAVQIFESDFQFWACAWNTDDVNYIYGGLQNGSVLVYDTRHTNIPVNTLTNNNYTTPMVSLVYVPVGGPASTCGLLMNTLETNGFWEKKDGAEWFCHNLEMDRKCTGMSFEPRTRHLLASYRASDEVRHTRRVMYNFRCQPVGATDTRMVTCTPIETFYGGSTMKQLTRSRLFPSPGSDKLFVCGGDEASGSAHIWDASSGKLSQKLQVNANVLDVCPFQSNNNHYLATLLENDVKIFNWKIKL